MAIVKYKNQSGVTYAYESISEWDPVKKQSRPKRRYLGRVDEETGEIIPTAGKRGRPRKNSSPKDPSVQETASSEPAVAADEEAASQDSVREIIARLQEENERLSEQNRQLKEALAVIYRQAASVMGQE